MSVQELQALHDKFVKMRANKDFSELGNLMFDDAIIMSPVHDPMNPKQMAEFYKVLQANNPNAKSEMIHKVESATPFGDVIIDRGTITLHSETMGKHHGHYLAVWKKDGGKLKVHDMCLSFPMPRPPK